jgi:lactoylglutathione lyase
MSDLRLTHVRLLARDFPACFRFYRDTLGLTPGFGSEHDVYSEFKAGPAIIALFQRPLMAAVVKTTALPPSTVAQDAVLLNLGVDDVDRAHAELVAKGVTFVTAPHDQPAWFLRVAHLRDPDGNLLELHAPLKGRAG